MGIPRIETRVWENRWILIASLLKKTREERKKNFALIAESRDTSRALIATEHFPLLPNRETSSTRERENNFSAPSRNNSTTPTRLRTTIRALIEENFDDDDPEYERFLEDVEEKGFSQ